MRRLLATMREVVIDRDIAEVAGRLRREHAIATPDAPALAHREGPRRPRKREG